ncbi:MAG: Beta-barrel assembly-enhancing protease [Candidatus Thorarchaeota archaeon AB_25]|nr:MAG: Beta-barrel assembly-enhancing protease [Candidatus Thorarchaeota archaeon AB_25]
MGGHRNNRTCEQLSETEIEDENILGHFQEAIQRVEVSGEMRSAIGVEYACLRSMMLEPRNATMWNALALVYMMSDCAQEAEEAIERSLDIDTSNAWTWTIWGDLLRQEGRLMESERAYRMATELDPNDIHAMRYLAVLRSERGAHPEAVDLFQTLISFTPNDQDLWDAYATCLRRLTD